MVTREGRAPIRQHPNEFTASQVPPHLRFGEICQTKPGEGRLVNQGRGVERKLPFDAHAQIATILLEFPGIKAVGRQAKVDAVV